MILCCVPYFIQKLVLPFVLGGKEKEAYLVVTILNDFNK